MTQLLTIAERQVLTMTERQIPAMTEYAEILRGVVNWKAWFAMCKNTENNLNTPTDRFIKGTLREQGLDVFSNGRLTHVNEEGRDNRDNILNLDIEFKTTKVRTGKGRIPSFIKARLKNTMGDNATGEIGNPADVYMFGNCKGIVICDYQTMRPYLYKTNDALSCKIPYNMVTPVIFYSELQTEVDAITERTTNVDYIEMRRQMHALFMSNFV